MLAGLRAVLDRKRRTQLMLSKKESLKVVSQTSTELMSSPTENKTSDHSTQFLPAFKLSKIIAQIMISQMCLMIPFPMVQLGHAGANTQTVKQLPIMLIATILGALAESDQSIIHLRLLKRIPHLQPMTQL